MGDTAWNRNLILAKLSEPFFMVLDRVFVAESEDDCHMFLEFIVRVEHVADEVPCQPVLLVGSYGGLDHPENLGNLLLLTIHLAIFLHPNRKRHFKIVESGEVGQGYRLSLPFGRGCLGVLGHALDSSLSLEHLSLSHEVVQ